VTPGNRLLPILGQVNRRFWTSGSDGILRICRCQSCGHWLHPPGLMCPKCRSRNLSWEPTCGKAQVFSFTINQRTWKSDVPGPYVIAIVELPEQEGLRMTSNVINCEVEGVYIGMPLRVTFERNGETYIPLFTPDRTSKTGSAE